MAGMPEFSESDVAVMVFGPATDSRAARALSRVAGEMGLGDDVVEGRVLRAVAAVSLGAVPETAAKYLDWKEFESFCGGLLRAAGYEVQENVVLRKPRAQIDIVASGPSLVLSIDCKHWKRAHAISTLAGFAGAQKKRSAAYRRLHREAEPIVSVILSFSEPEGRFVNGAAIVPVRTLRSFLESVESYSGLLEFS